MMYPTRPSGFSSRLLARIFTIRARSGALPGYRMISVGLIFASQTQHPNVYHRGGVSGGQGGWYSLSINWGRVAEKFCVLIQKIAVEDFIGCATSAPYGSSPRVSVRVVDSRRDFNSAIVCFRSVGHNFFGCLNQSSLWE